MKRILSKSEVIDHLAEHFGLTLAEVLAVLNSPNHPSGLRDDFAKAALPGCVEKFRYPENAAEEAYKIADAMLAARVSEVVK